MSDDRLTKKIFMYDQNFAKTNKHLTCWSSEVDLVLTRNNLFFSVDSFGPKQFVQMLSESLLRKDIEMINSQCRKAPKLRTYNKLFSPFADHVSACKYTQLSLPFIVRKRHLLTCDNLARFVGQYVIDAFDQRLVT